MHSNLPMTPMLRRNSPSLRSQRQSPLAVPAKKTDQMSPQDRSANRYPSHPSERMPQNHNDTNIPKNRPVIPPPFTPQRSQQSRNDAVVPTSHRQSYENHNTKPISIRNPPSHDDVTIPTSCRQSPSRGCHDAEPLSSAPADQTPKNHDDADISKTRQAIPPPST